MATYVSYTPTGVFDKALFNFDSIAGIPNYIYSGVVRVSFSSPFTYGQHLSLGTAPEIYTADSLWAPWSTAQREQLNLITQTYSNFIDLQFSNALDYQAYNPYGVGLLTNSNINISIIYRPDISYAGFAALRTDHFFFGYTQARGDLVINQAQLPGGDTSFESDTHGFHTLMHEIGHNLGLSHPHSSFNGTLPVITADYAATANVGFGKLGFLIENARDMYREYFSIMSYDHQAPSFYFDTFAQTPMILDVIALQAAYGEGTGSTGAGNSVVIVGGTGGVAAYRTYFDPGGNDTIDVSNYVYEGGVYLHMGTTITGAPHLVGVSMSISDADSMFSGGEPDSLRWYYGEFESARGTSLGDLIVGNRLKNTILANGGSDVVIAGNGNDTVNGASGNDSLTGGSGSDRLTGGNGADKFVFEDGLGASNKDTITDFTSGVDKIWLDDDVFKALSGPGGLASGAFYVGAAAHDPGDRIIYNRPTGALFYDPDGTGPLAQTQFALLGVGSHPVLKSTDFAVVG